MSLASYRSPKMRIPSPPRQSKTSSRSPYHLFDQLHLVEKSTYAEYGVDVFRLKWRFKQEVVKQMIDTGTLHISNIVSRELPEKPDKWRIQLCMQNQQTMVIRLLPWSPSSLRIVDVRCRFKHARGNSIYSTDSLGNDPDRLVVYVNSKGGLANRVSSLPHFVNNIKLKIDVTVGYHVTLPGRACQNISGFRLSNNFTDAVLVSDDGKEFPVHRIILVGASEFFKSAFCHDTKESRSRKITIPDLDHDSLELLIHLVYGNRLEDTHSSSLLKEVFVAAERYQLTNAMHQIADELHKRTLPADELVDTYLFAKHFGLSKLKRRILKEIVKEWKHFVEAGGLVEIGELGQDVLDSFLQEFNFED